MVPVIDYDRCTNCMQCLSFCLFDVYGVDQDQKLQVQKESNCKTDCPACSRVCPEAAILFPKYKKSPINGAEVKEEDLAQESMKVDISALLGGDIYGDRCAIGSERCEASASRPSATSRRHLLERKRCLKALQKDLDIPDEVLMTLPSAGEHRGAGAPREGEGRESAAHARGAVTGPRNGADDDRAPTTGGSE